MVCQYYVRDPDYAGLMLKLWHFYAKLMCVAQVAPKLCQSYDNVVPKSCVWPKFCQSHAKVVPRLCQDHVCCLIWFKVVPCIRHRQDVKWPGSGCGGQAQGIDAAEMDYVCDVARGHGRSNLRAHGLLPALVVRGKIFSFRLGRFLNAAHLLALQGIAPWRLNLLQPFSYMLSNKLAGNAMTESVLGAIVMPLLAYARLSTASGQEPLMQPPSRPLARSPPQPSPMDSEAESGTSESDDEASS